MLLGAGGALTTHSSSSGSGLGEGGGLLAEGALLLLERCLLWCRSSLSRLLRGLLDRDLRLSFRSSRSFSLRRFFSFRSLLRLSSSDEASSDETERARLDFLLERFGDL